MLRGDGRGDGGGEHGDKDSVWMAAKVGEEVVKEISARNGAEMDILQTMCVKEVWGAELQEKEAMLIR